MKHTPTSTTQCKAQSNPNPTTTVQNVPLRPSHPLHCLTPFITRIEDWIDGQDVMQILHISPRTLQTLRTKKILPYAKLQGKIYYKKSDLEKILNQNYTP